MTSTKNTSIYGKNWQSIDTCCLDISLHNRYQEGLYLAGALKWVNSRFSNCLISLGDTLHRHNLRHRHPNEKESYDVAYELGEKWIKNNKKYLDVLEIPHKIIRSHQWLSDPDFKAVHDALWDFYHTDHGFKNIIKEDIETFIARKNNLPVPFVRTASLSYLLEETAADILLGKRGGVAHLYPGKRHNCYGYLIQNADNIPGILTGLENSGFKRLSPAKTRLNAYTPQITDTANENKQKAS